MLELFTFTQMEGSGPLPSCGIIHDFSDAIMEQPGSLSRSNSSIDAEYEEVLIGRRSVKNGSASRSDGKTFQYENAGSDYSETSDSYDDGKVITLFFIQIAEC